MVEQQRIPRLDTTLAQDCGNPGLRTSIQAEEFFVANFPCHCGGDWKGSP